MTTPATQVLYTAPAVGAVERSLDTWLSEVLSLKDFGAIGDGVTDDTEAVQAWIDACIQHGFKGRVPSVEIGYRLTSTIEIKSAVSLYGDGCEMQIGALGETQTRGRGSWFFLDHTGQGFLLNDPTQHRTGMLLSGIGTYRTQPATTGPTFTPTAHDFDIVVKQCDATLRDINIYNATKGVLHWAGGYGRLSIYGMRGQPLQEGIVVNDTADTCRIRDVHFWPFFSNGTPVRSYVLTNGKAIVMKDADNPDLAGIFTIGYANALSLEPVAGTLAMPLKVRLSNFDFDNGGCGIRIASGGAHGSTMLVSNGYITGTPIAGGTQSNIDIAGNNNEVIIDNVGLDLPMASCLKVAGVANILRIGSIKIGRWNYNSSGATAINVAANNIALFSIRPMLTGAPTGGTSWFGGAGQFDCPLLTGTASVTTDAAGRANITHNLGIAPRVAICNSFGGTFRIVQAVSSSASIFTVEVRTAAGALVASTPGIPVHFKLSY